jgi:transposase InsO family protein
MAHMPWKETDVMKERVRFILEWEQLWNELEGLVNVSELCRKYGISRETGYLWLRRYQDAGHDLAALQERSRRPLSSPTATSEEVQDLVVAARKAHPRWGPRKLRAWLLEREPGIVWPSASTMSNILQRRGLTKARRGRRRRRAPAVAAPPFSECDEPNAVWCIDFKGKFRLGDGQWCHVLTLLDAYSRYLLRCEALLEPSGRSVEEILDSAFQEFGLPLAIRSDNGPPFASTGAGRLTRLSVWWLRLGIALQRIQPGKPQQNGRQERVHLTLDLEDVVPRANVRVQQRVIDLWRREYNEERPHEALELRPPASVYDTSPRRYPRPLLRPEADPWAHPCRVDAHGFIRWQRRKLFISSALRHENVSLQLRDFDAHDGKWEVRYGAIVLGTIDETRLDRGIILPRRRRGAARVTTLSLLPAEKD